MNVNTVVNSSITIFPNASKMFLATQVIFLKSQSELWGRLVGNEGTCIRLFLALGDRKLSFWQLFLQPLL